MFFLLTSLLVVYIIAISIPKRISWLQIWSTSLFSLVMETFSDMTLDFKLNLFGYIAPGLQWSGFLPIFLYPPVNVIFLNYYPYGKTKHIKLIYFVCWIAFCLAFEVAALSSGFFHYLRWNLWYSALCYPILLLIVLLNYRFTDWLHHRANKAIHV